MIHFKKINDLVADVYSDGVKIGHVENLGNGYNVEISYLRTFLSTSNSKMVVSYINKLFKRLEARKMREAKPLRDYNEFKIIE